MKSSFYKILILFLLFNSCSDELEEPTALLSQVIKFYEDLDKREIIAFGAGADNITDRSYIYFYVEPGAENFQYFQTNLNSDLRSNFNNYFEVELEIEDIIPGKLKRFVRNQKSDSNCIITYQKNNVFYISEPIAIQNFVKGTSYTSNININQNQSLSPIFSWQFIGADLIYHQLVKSISNDLLSGTFTIDNNFQYGSSVNVINTITSSSPSLVANENYIFQLFAIDKFNWVDTVFEVNFRAQ